MGIERLSCWRLMPLAGILVCAAFLVAPAHAAKPKIGRTSLIVKQVEGTSENIKRQLALKDPVFQDEFVETGVLSASELRFIDDTRITVGPSSSVVLDDFVYDPDPGKGVFALRMTEGVFRFFSGNMDSTNYSIDAPSVTVGVRGTIIVGAINPVDGAFALILESAGSEAFLATRTGRTAVVNAPGMAAVAHADGSVSVGDPPAWALAMVEAMDRIISQANLTVPPDTGRDSTATASLLPPPPGRTPPGTTPPGTTPPGTTPPGGQLRGLSRAIGNQDSDSPPPGLGRAIGRANGHATAPNGGPGHGNNGQDSSAGGRGNAGGNGNGGGVGG